MAVIKTLDNKERKDFLRTTFVIDLVGIEIRFVDNLGVVDTALLTLDLDKMNMVVRMNQFDTMDFFKMERWWIEEQIHKDNHSFF